MLYATSLLGRRLVLPAAFIFLGALAYGSGSSNHDDAVFVANHSCRVFKGSMAGNDPSLMGKMNLCRDGRDVYGQLETIGESGFSKVALTGKVQCDGSIRLSDRGPIEVRPMDDWMFCFDDEFTLVWDAQNETLRGQYTSSDCDDRGQVHLTRY